MDPFVVTILMRDYVMMTDQYSTMKLMNVREFNDALFVTNPTNIRYLTGFVGVEPTERESFVLKTDNKIYFFTNSLYIEQTKTLSPILISRENPISKELEKITSKLNIKKMEFEDDNLTVAEFTKLTQVLTNVELIPSRGAIEAMRMIKRKDEIENIRLAAALTDTCFKILLKNIRPGMTERKLSLYIEGFFKSRGADLAFSPIVAFNKHSSQPHYMSRGNNPLRKNSLILLDFGARVNGYCADMTRVVFLGTPKPEWVKTYNQVLSANQKGLELLKIGERDGAVLDTAANIPPYPHSLGHGVGLDIHEAPRLTAKKPEMLKTNMVVTIEPGKYIEGQYGIRIEDLVLLKDKSIEILSKSNKELIIL